MTSFAFDASGHLKPPSAEALTAADEDTAILAYTTGTIEDGTPYYAYVAVKPSRYAEFHAMTAARETMTISDYGKIIRGGYAPAAPPEVVKEMREKYGFDEHYAEKLRREFYAQQKTFLASQEEARLDGIVTLLKRKDPDGSAN